MTETKPAIVETKAIVTDPPKKAALTPEQVEERDRAFLEERGLDISEKKLIQHAAWLAKSQMIPKHYQNNPQDIYLVAKFAERSGLDLMTALQGTDVIHGTPSLRAKLAITLANASGVFTGGIHYKTKGEGQALEVTAFAKMTISGEVVSASASFAMAMKEGWTTKPGNKYQSMPEQMLCYRAAKFLISRYAPEILYGFGIKEEGETWDLQRGTSKPQQASRLQARLSPANTIDHEK